MTSCRRLILSMLAAVPWAGLAIAFTLTTEAHRKGISWQEPHRSFWGGNPAEVYSHWLDMILMSGNMVILAWLLIIEALWRKQESNNHRIQIGTKLYAALTFVASGACGILLDRSHGEGTVLIVYPVFFLPILGSTWYLLRRLADWVEWKTSRVLY